MFTGYYCSIKPHFTIQKLLSFGGDALIQIFLNFVPIRLLALFNSF